MDRKLPQYRVKTLALLVSALLFQVEPSYASQAQPIAASNPALQVTAIKQLNQQNKAHAAANLDDNPGLAAAGFYSATKSIGSDLAVSVDPRTGGLLFNYPLIQTSGIAGTPLGLNLNLTYNSNFMYTPSHFGLYNGWNFNLTYLDTTSNTLYLSNGQAYGVNSSYGLTYLKLTKTVSFVQDGGKLGDGREYSYIVAYMNGDNEYLDGNGNMLEHQDRFGNRIDYYYGQNGTGAGATQLSQIVQSYNGYSNKYTFNYSNSSGGFTLTFPDNTDIEVHTTNQDYISIRDRLYQETGIELSTWSGGSTTIPTEIDYPNGLVKKTYPVNLPFTVEFKGQSAVDNTDLVAISGIQTTDNNTNQQGVVKYSYDNSDADWNAYSNTDYTGTDGSASSYGYPVSSSSQSDPLMDSGNSYYGYCVAADNTTTGLSINNCYNSLGLLMKKNIDSSMSAYAALPLETIRYSYPGIDQYKSSAYPNFAHAPSNFQEASEMDVQLFMGQSSGGSNFITNFTYRGDGTGLLSSETLANGQVQTDGYNFYKNNSVVLPASVMSIDPNTKQGIETNNTYTMQSSGWPEASETISSGTVDQGNFKDIKDTVVSYDANGRITQEVIKPGQDATSLGLNTDVSPLMITYTYGDIQSGSNGNDATYTVTKTATGKSFDGKNTEKIITSEVIDAVSGLVLSSTDGNGNTTSYQYDALGRVTQTTDANNNVIKTAYSLGVSLPNGATANAITKTNTATGYAVEYAYDARGNLIYTFDNSNADHSINVGKDPERLLTGATYDMANRVTSEIVYDGNSDNKAELTTTYEYNDPFGRLTAIHNPDGTTQTITYNDIATTGKNGESSVTSYTVSSDSSLKSPSTVKTYDEMNELIQNTLNSSTVNNASFSQSLSYDALGNETSMSFKDDNASFTHSNNNFNSQGLYLPWLQSEKIANTDNGNNLNTGYQYDYLGNLLQSSVKQTFNGNQDGPMDQDSNAYNSFDEIEQVNDANKEGPNIETMDYDANGNLKQFMNWEGDEFDSSYNSLNQLKEMQEKNNQNIDIQYNYDSNSEQLKQVSFNGDSSKAINYTYTGDGLISSISYPGNGKLNNPTIFYTYYPDGSIETMTDVTGAVTQYTYYAISDNSGDEAVAGKLESASLTLKGEKSPIAVINYQYDNLGRLTEVKRQSSNGTILKTDYSYNDPYERLSEIKTTGNNGELIQDIKVTLDNRNNILTLNSNADSKVNNGNYNTTYTYDFLSRLVTSVRNGDNSANHNYNYDTNSNIVIDSNTNYKYHNFVELNNVTANHSTSSVNYNDNADMTQDDQKNQYQYNDLDQMTGYNPQNGKAYTYTYYPNGLRASKTDGSTTIYFYYDASGNLLTEMDNQGNSASYLAGLDKEARIIQQGGNNQVHFYVHDITGSVVGTVDNQGNLENNQTLISYSDTGVASNVPGTGSNLNIGYNPIQFAGYSDEEDGLDNSGDSVYNPALSDAMQKETSSNPVYSTNMIIHTIGVPAGGGAAIPTNLDFDNADDNVAADRLAFQQAFALDMGARPNSALYQNVLETGGTLYDKHIANGKDPWETEPSLVKPTSNQIPDTNPKTSVTEPSTDTQAKSSPMGSPGDSPILGSESESEAAPLPGLLPEAVPGSNDESFLQTYYNVANNKYPDNNTEVDGELTEHEPFTTDDEFSANESSDDEFYGSDKSSNSANPVNPAEQGLGNASGDQGIVAAITAALAEPKGAGPQGDGISEHGLYDEDAAYEGGDEGELSESEPIGP